MKSNIVASLDIGSYSIKVLVAQKIGRDWEIVAKSQVPSFGLRKGAVINIEATAKNIQTLIAQIKREHNIKISSVFVNIGGNHLYVIPSDGIISVSRADQRISKEDIERVLQAAKAINIPHNDEVLDVFPREYIIDDQKGIKDPEGLTGVRLEVKALLLCYFQPYFTNLTQAVLNAGLQINDITPSPLAAAQAVLTPQQKELGVALIDIGSDTTSLVVFEESELIHFAVFPIGSGNITKDIAIGLKTEIAIAEAIKKQYGTSMLSKAEKEKKDRITLNQTNKKIEIAGYDSAFSFTKKDLADIIEPRVEEILDLIQKELKKIGRQELLPAGVVITGGGAKIPKIKEFAKEKLRLNCQIGEPKDILGLEKDPEISTVAGLILGGIVFGSEESIIGLTKGWREGIKKFFKLFIP